MTAWHARRVGWRFAAWLVTVLACPLLAWPLLACKARPGDSAALAPVGLSQVCVESGQLDVADGGALTVRSAMMRAIVPNSSGATAELAFTYRGASREVAPLASGELRRQIALKLRAADTCNVVYVAWHVAPSSGLHVAVKSNPGQSLHAQCADHGYRSIAPTRRSDVSPIRVDEPRTLSARIDGDVLHISVDGALAWEGTLPSDAFAFDGPVGIRTDNGAFDMELRAAPGRGRPCAR